MGGDRSVTFGWAGPEDVPQFGPGFAEDIAGRKFFIAKKASGDVVGMARFDGTQMSSLYVMPKSRTISNRFLKEALRAHFERSPKLSMVYWTGESEDGRQKQLERWYRIMGAQQVRNKQEPNKPFFVFQRKKLFPEKAPHRL